MFLRKNNGDYNVKSRRIRVESPEGTGLKL